MKLFLVIQETGAKRLLEMMVVIIIFKCAKRYLRPFTQDWRYV